MEISESAGLEILIAYMASQNCASCYAEMHAEEKAQEKRDVDKDRIQETGAAADTGLSLSPGTPEAAKNLVLSELQSGLDAQAAPGTTANASNDLSEDEQATVESLEARDKEVRDHEQAHARVGGPYAGEPSYTYQTGPDGRQYAIGGEVPIDVAPIADDPAATIDKMEVVKAAALAPAEPSAQDRRVAALADTQRTEAMGDLAEQRRVEAQAMDNSEVRNPYR